MSHHAWQCHNRRSHWLQMFLLFHEAEEESSAFATEVGTYVDLQQKVVSLESTIKDKDAALTELRNELDAMKVICYRTVSIKC